MDGEGNVDVGLQQDVENVDVGDVVGGREDAEQSVGMFVSHLMGAIRQHTT